MVKAVPQGDIEWQKGKGHMWQKCHPTTTVSEQTYTRMGHMSISEEERQTANPILQAHRAEWRGDTKASHRVWKARLVGTVGSEGEDTNSHQQPSALH